MVSLPYAEAIISDGDWKMQIAQAMIEIEYLRSIKMEARSAMPRQVETFRGAVYPWEIDVMGHMNVRHYMAKYDDATLQLFGMLGLTVAYFRNESRGMGAVQQNLSYRRELFPGDLIAIRSEIVEFGRRKLRFFHRLFDTITAEEVAMADMIGVHFDRETHRAVPFPDAVRRSAATLME